MPTHEERKAYFRNYQKKRYAEKKAKVAKENLNLNVDALQQYHAAVEACGFKEHKYWRQRQRLKEEILGPKLNAVAAIKTKLHKHVKQQAAQRGIDNNLLEDDISLPEYCPILNLKLTYALGNGTPDQASIDRIDSTKGYCVGNVQTISLRANILKRDATLEELVALGEWAKKILGENGER